MSLQIPSFRQIAAGVTTPLFPVAAAVAMASLLGKSVV